jgi:hypothetical protein
LISVVRIRVVVQLSVVRKSLVVQAMTLNDRRERLGVECEEYRAQYRTLRYTKLKREGLRGDRVNDD